MQACLLACLVLLLLQEGWQAAALGRRYLQV